MACGKSGRIDIVRYNLGGIRQQITYNNIFDFVS